MKFDKLTNQELFDWLKKHPSKSGVIEAEKRWTDFWQRAKERINRAYSVRDHIDVTVRDLEREIRKVEVAVMDIKDKQRRFNKRTLNQRLALITANLQAVTSQLKAREPEPTPYVPAEQWEAFQVFLSKLDVKRTSTNQALKSSTR